MTRAFRTAFPIDRRALLGAFAASLVARPGHARQAPGQPVPLDLRARQVARALRADGKPSALWALEAADGRRQPAFRRGDTIAVSFRNELPVPAVLNWHGLDGQPETEPLLARPPVAPGAVDAFTLKLPRAGTLMCDARLLGDGAARAASALALVVGDDGLAADRDAVWLIEDWRLGPDGGAVAPGGGVEGAPAPWTVNGATGAEIALRPGERLRLRFINGSQRNAIVLKIENYEVRVMAIDGAPAEPFVARDGRLVLAPGTRIDTVIDAAASGSAAAILLGDGAAIHTLGRLTTAGEPLRAAPLPEPSALPSNGLPEQLSLRDALRADLALDRLEADGGWTRPARLTPAAQPAFRVKRGRTVVLALANRATVPVTFHLHGHHVRLLDRLDDGWKPFWLDTVIVPPRVTERVAFLAAHAGRFAIAAGPPAWDAARRIFWFVVA